MKWLRRRLGAKLLAVLFLIGFVPFLSILVYSEYYGEKKMSAGIMTIQRAQMEQIHRNLRLHLNLLGQNLDFLAAVPIMDDLLIGDLDQRILLALKRYRRYFGENTVLSVIGKEEKVVASTDLERIGKPCRRFGRIRSAMQKGTALAQTKKQLLLYAPIHASFRPERTIGFLVLEYPLSVLSRFDLDETGVVSALVRKSDGYAVGPFRMNPEALRESGGMVKNADELILYTNLGDTLPGWYLVYRIDKQTVFGFITELNRYLILMLLGGVAVIALLSYWISRRIVAPLVELEAAASEMTRYQQYDIEVPVRSADEIGRLAGSFNTMLSEIRFAFDALAEENRLRTLRLTRMIVLFNRLLKTETESQCIKIALQELDKVLPGQRITFRKEDDDPHMPAIFVRDFDHQTLRYYGSLILPASLVGSKEAELYQAAASMIAARIDQLRAYERLRSDAEAKTAFISHLSHDLRTPLHAIMAQTQYLISYEALSEAQQDKVGRIESAAARLLSMINDLLDLAKLESGKYDTTLETLEADEVRKLLDESIEMLAPLAEQKSLWLRRRGGLGTTRVMADRRLLRQIVMNLLSNAIKFTDRGGITCELALSGGHAVLSVEDTGQGIDPGSLSRAFEAFSQVHDAASRASKGTGLGLALSRRFARLFGAELRLESEGRGRGTRAVLVFTTL